MKIKLAEALLRRKELQQKVNVLQVIDREKLFEVKVTRKPAHEGIDDVIAQVPKIGMEQITHSFDWHAKQLRRVDASIQQANWETELDVDEQVMADYVDPYVRK